MINRAERTLEDRLIKEVARLRRDIESLKSAQLLGGDNLVIDSVGPVALSITLAPGASHFYTINFTSAAHQFYLSEPSLSFYINTDLDAAHSWPGGSALNTAELQAFDRGIHYDNQLSNELGTGVKTYVLNITNTGTVNNKTIYSRIGLILPEAQIS